MSTEGRHERARGLDDRGIGEILSLMNREDRVAVEAVEKALPDIEAALVVIVERLKSGGKLYYVGAGTSGRLGVLDAVEMLPTFNVGGEMIQALLAGGQTALTIPVEGAEDDEEAGEQAMVNVKDQDAVVGISASGKTPYVLAALRRAKSLGADVRLMACNPVSHDFLDGLILLDTGSEVVAGSTRLKAGTATKMALNMISTTAMIKLGRVYDGYMIDVVPSSGKLRGRALNIVRELTGLPEEEADALLELAGNNPKTAILMQRLDVGWKEAQDMLEASHGSLREALRSAGAEEA